MLVAGESQAKHIAAFLSLRSVQVMHIQSHFLLGTLTYSYIFISPFIIRSREAYKEAFLHYIKAFLAILTSKPI